MDNDINGVFSDEFNEKRWAQKMAAELQVEQHNSEDNPVVRLPEGLDFALIQAMLDDYEWVVKHGEVEQAGRYLPANVDEQARLLSDWICKQGYEVTHD